MKFGLSFLPDHSKESCATKYFSGLLSLCQYADEHDYNFVKITEHYLHSYGGFCPDPLVFLAFVAGMTKKIRLMTGCVLPVFHHPIVIASRAALVDCISQGRLDVGFARAYLPYEFETFNIPLNENWERFTQTLLAVQHLWLNENVSVSTPYFKFNDVTSLPRNYQKPHPPIWGAAVNSRQSFAWLGENGFNLLVTPPLDGNWQYWKEKIEIYLDAFKSNQPKDKTPKVALSLPLMIDEDQASVEIDGKHYLQKYLSTWLEAVKKGENVPALDYPNYNFLVQTIQTATPQSLIKNLEAIVGTPENVIEKIDIIKKFNLVDYILWQIDYGMQPYERSFKTLKLFTEKVKHKFKDVCN